MPRQVRLVVDDSVPFEFFKVIDAVVLKFREYMLLEEHRPVTVDPLIISFSDEDDAILNSHIRDLGLKTIITNALLDKWNSNEFVNIVTVGDLVKYSARDLLTLRGIGEKAIADIRIALDRHVLCLKGEESLDSEVRFG